MRKVPILYLLLAVILFAGWFWTRNYSAKTIENKEFTSKINRLIYTKHGRCRMKCRNITEAEVKEIILHGSINPAKSAPADKPCPTIAVEGYSSTDQQHIRVVIADCKNELKLVTCIDLDKNHRCSCY